jgi:hypothetical protein
MGRIAAILGGVLVLAILAGGLTEAALARGHYGGIGDDVLLRPKKTTTPSPSVTPKVAATPTPTATPVPTATPAPLPTAVTISFVHMRASKSFSAPILFDLNGGTVVTVLPDADAQWQQVQYSGQTGYIYRTYLSY